jgi:hypothetical protein
MPKFEVMVELKSLVSVIVEAEDYNGAVMEALAIAEPDGFTAEAIGCFECD